MIPLRQCVHIASRQLFYFLVIIIVLGLLGIISAAWLSDNVAKRKDDIASMVSHRIGYPVEIGSVNISWVDLFPKLRINQLRVLQKGKQTPVVTVEDLFVGLNLISSLHQKRLVVDKVKVRGVQLSLKRNQDNQFSIVGLSSSTAVNPSTNVLAWLDILHRVELNQLTINFEDQGKQHYSGHYLVKTATLVHQGKKWQSKAQFDLPTRLGGSADLTAALTLDEKQQPSEWDISLATDQLNIGALTSSLQWHSLQLKKGRVSLSLLASKHPLKGQNITADIDLSQAVISTSQANAKASPLNIKQFSGHLSWQKQQSHWQLDGRQIKMVTTGKPWSATAFSINKQADGTITVSSPYIRLGDLSSLALLSPDSPLWLRKQKPSGDIQGLTLSYQPEQGLTTLKLQADKLALLPWQDYPGVAGLSFSVDWQQGQGMASFNSHKVTLYPKSWLDNNVYLDSISGSLSLQKQGPSWQFTSQQLDISNNDFKLQLDGHLESGEGKMDSDLKLTMQQVAVNHWKKYVPKSILYPDFWQWAEHAFVKGKITSGTIEFKGQPAAYPFDKKPDAGDFKMALNVEAVQLHYAPGWPDLTNVDGTITGKGDDLLIKSQSGAVAGMQFNNVTSRVNDLVRDKPQLTVAGELHGSTAQALDFLQKSPLKSRFGMVAKWIKAQGKSNVKLKLTVPLTHVDDTQVQGQITFNDSTLTYAATPELSCSKVNGSLYFNNKGIKAKNIKAVAFNKPITINVMPNKNTTLVTIDGDADVKTLRELWPDILPDFVSGALRYQTQLSVNEQKTGKFELSVATHSDLQGITLSLPAPLGKKAKEKRPLKWSVAEQGSDSLVYRFDYDGLLNGVLTPDKSHWRGEIYLGNDKAVLPTTGLTLKGQLKELSLDSWLDWQQQQSTASSSELALPLSKIDLKIGHLSLFDQPVTQLIIHAQRSTWNWKIKLQSDQLKGDVSLPVDDTGTVPLTLNLDYLKLTLPEGIKAENKKLPDSLWPAIDAQINQLSINGMDLGRFQLHAQRQPNSWDLQKASLQSAVIDAKASGRWQKSTSVNQSSLSLNLHSDDMKGLLASLGYQQAVEAKNTTVKTSLSWPGNPLAVSNKTIAGKLTLKVGRGQLLDVEPGAAGRIFGLLSFAAIPRRLSLDFSDLFGKGFAFSSVSGHFDFANGIARTDDLLVDGDSAVISMKGPVDIVQKTYNQTVKITPNVSSTLPLAGAAAGGPVGLGVGAAIMLVDKIASNVFDQEIVNVISYRYDLTGPWSDPQLNVIKAPAK